MCITHMNNAKGATNTLRNFNLYKIRLNLKEINLRIVIRARAKEFQLDARAAYHVILMLKLVSLQKELSWRATSSEALSWYSYILYLRPSYVVELFI